MIFDQLRFNQKPSKDQIIATLIEEIPIEGPLFERGTAKPEQAMTLKSWRKHLDFIIAELDEIEDENKQQAMLQRYRRVITAMRDFEEMQRPR